MIRTIQIKLLKKAFYAGVRFMHGKTSGTGGCGNDFRQTQNSEANQASANEIIAQFNNMVAQRAANGSRHQVESSGVAIYQYLPNQAMPADISSFLPPYQTVDANQIAQSGLTVRDQAYVIEFEVSTPPRRGEGLSITTAATYEEGVEYETNWVSSVWQSGIGNGIEPVTLLSGRTPNYPVLADFMSLHFRDRAVMLANDTRLANSSTGFLEVISRMQNQTFTNVREHHERLGVFVRESRRVFGDGASIYNYNPFEGIGAVLNLFDTPTLEALETFFSLPVRGLGTQGFQILIESGMFVGFFFGLFFTVCPAVDWITLSLINVHDQFQIRLTRLLTWRRFHGFFTDNLFVNGQNNLQTVLNSFVERLPSLTGVQPTTSLPSFLSGIRAHWRPYFFHLSLFATGVGAAVYARAGAGTNVSEVTAVAVREVAPMVSSQLDALARMLARLLENQDSIFLAILTHLRDHFY